MLANDSDIDGTLNAASITITTPATNGTAVANANGTVTYASAAGFTGTATFAYTVRDNLGAASAPAGVTVSVVPGNETITVTRARYESAKSLWTIDGTTTVFGVGVTNVMTVYRGSTIPGAFAVLGTAPVTTTGTWTLRVTLPNSSSNTISVQSSGGATRLAAPVQVGRNTITGGVPVTALPCMIVNGCTTNICLTPPEGFMRSALYFLSLTAMTALSSPALAGVINLPQTGQTIQAAAGDDGALLKGAVWPASRFTANPDQTVSDSLSGLVWNSNGNTHTPTGLCGVSGTDRSWTDALAYVSCLNSNVYLGFTDWRLPTVTELGTLPSAGQPDSAAWLNSQGFSAVQARFYWSSTSDASAPADFAWSVQLSSGATFSDDKTATFPVIAVRRGPVAEPLPLYPANNRRSGQVVSIAAGDDGALLRGVSWPAARFTLQSTGSGVVNDNLTRLVWLKDAGTPTVAACSGGPVNWAQALAYVDCLNGINYQGRSDWRLPNRAELESLVDYSASGPALPAAHPFTNLAGSLWSSTSDAADASNSAWYLTLFDGSLFSR